MDELRRKSKRIATLLFVLSIFFGIAGSDRRASDLPRLVGQEPAADAPPADDAATDQRLPAYFMKVPLPLRGTAVENTIAQLRQLAAKVDEGASRRPTVILQFGDPTAGNDPATTGLGSRFEDALALARFLTSPESRRLRTIGLVAGPLQGHAVLALIACDEFAVTADASLGQATVGEADVDQAVTVVYQSIAAGRGVLPEAVVAALVNPGASLFRVAAVDGSERFVLGDDMASLREEGGVWKEEQIVAPGEPLKLTADSLRSYRWASQLVRDADELRQVLGLAELRTLDDSVEAAAETRLLELFGDLNPRRINRIISNLAAATEQQQVDSIVMVIDSAGGELNSSLPLALQLADPDDSLFRVTGFVSHRALGDAALLAVACRPLYLHPDARVGGVGAQYIQAADVDELRRAFEEFERLSGRSSALLRGLMDPSLEVYRCLHVRTGEVAYLAEDDPRLADGTWQQGAIVELADGLSAEQAIELGLAEGTRQSLDEVLAVEGLVDVPQRLSDRPVIHAVEWLAGLPWLPQLLIFIGFLTLSMEMSAPGIGIPGFLSLTSFLLFFWISFLSGTAEWLEILLFAGGVACLLLEVLVLPGVGVFGIGGLVMIVAALILMSQTFVVPHNAYQIGQTTEGLITVLAAFVGIGFGLIALRYMLPGTPLFRYLVMPGPASEEMLMQEQREHIVHYDYLLGQRGETVTPLRPSGKARFGDEIYSVVSEGEMLVSGEPVKVVLVQGNRIVVEPLPKV